MKKKRSLLERQMLSYFGLIAMASMLITGEFVWAVQVIMSKTESLAGGAAGGGWASPVLKALLDLQNKSLLMGVVQAVVTLIVLIMFTRKITGPLQQMVDQSRLIAEGDLSRTISIRRRDEIGLLGETINGLTSNIQEIVAYGLATDTATRSALEDLRAKLDGDPAVAEPLKKIESQLCSMRALLEGFQLLPAPHHAQVSFAWR